MAVDGDRRIPGYPNDPVREKTRITPFEVYEYETPFNYPNVEVDRVWKGGERHGIELFAVKTTEDGGMMREPADGIIIHEDDPIIRVAVLGSACTPPGVVFIEATPVDGFRHEGENEDAMPVSISNRQSMGHAPSRRSARSGGDLPHAPACRHELRNGRDSTFANDSGHGRGGDSGMVGGRVSRRCALFTANRSNHRDGRLTARRRPGIRARAPKSESEGARDGGGAPAGSGHSRISLSRDTVESLCHRSVRVDEALAKSHIFGESLRGLARAENLELMGEHSQVRDVIRSYMTGSSPTE